MERNKLCILAASFIIHPDFVHVSHIPLLTQHLSSISHIQIRISLMELLVVSD